ncbi:2,3-diaminopropionate biosynthesis protein SbnB [Streptomyces coeruleorubidus]|uniref:2,3-diaminopropionate biosynthesis protein SbnB n=1 Tax=Streptomyces coeruleorubidus TaxID=116188 RepID=UPI0018754170|nr:2,3-diaminopropionate biosynthesis protein SbnB [Streptomyces bellus]GGT80250.1 2,3-diaminopropionate biosynthesis protein SbnB [Streptomyces bellus]
MLVLRKADVEKILGGREKEHIELVRQTYSLHDKGATAVPHSIFLRFPDQPANRIIGLPSYRGGDNPAAGLKWISSFPANIHSGIARASAVMVLNSLRTGHPEALLEASLISAARTAASAALAADILTEGRRPQGVSLIGCGVINLEILRYLKAAIGTLGEITLYDTSRVRAEEFARRCHELLPDAGVTLADSIEDALEAQRLVSFATNAGEPHVDLTPAEPGTVVLHVSLRDIDPLSINGAHNIVDDADHVCRERTSLHLTEQITGGRAFIDASIGQLINGTAAFTPDPDKVTVYSPFGLGVLDLALADDVHTTARELGIGLEITDFLS